MGNKDYSKLIDAETWAFIETTRSYYPDNTTGRSISHQRSVYDAMCSHFSVGNQPNVSWKDIAIDGRSHKIGLREYVHNTSVHHSTVLYCHGGGFVLGGLESHHDICAEVCQRTGYRVISVDYRLAPENLHPAAFDDAMSALNWIHENKWANVIACGDSAGGNLAAALCHKTRESPLKPVGQVLIYPVLGGNTDQGSFVEHAHAPLLSANGVEYYAKIRIGSDADLTDPSYDPLRDNNFANLPPSVIFSAEFDPLCDDGKTYAESIATAGGKSQWFHEAGMIHGYLRARHSANRARSSFTRIVEAIEVLGRNEWPYSNP